MLCVVRRSAFKITLRYLNLLLKLLVALGHMRYTDLAVPHVWPI